MAADEETKICPRCAETIKGAARICPFCQKRQKGFPIWFTPLAISAILSIVLFTSGLIWLVNDMWPLNARKFSAHRNDLQVVRASIELARMTPEAWYRNLSTNELEKKWTIRELEIRFLDSDGNLIGKQDAWTGDDRLFVGSGHWLTGYITNSGKYAWRVSKIEARFFDTEGNLVDVKNPNFYPTVVVSPQSEQAFRVEFMEGILTNADLDLKVRVQEASDANSKED